MKPVEVYCQEVLKMIKVMVQGMKTKNEKGVAPKEMAKLKWNHDKD